MSVNAATFGPPLPPPTEAELVVIRAEADRLQELYGQQTWDARRWRWRRFVIRMGGKGLRTFAREKFLREEGIVHLFDAEEAKRA